MNFDIHLSLRGDALTKNKLKDDFRSEVRSFDETTMAFSVNSN